MLWDIWICLRILENWIFETFGIFGIFRILVILDLETLGDALGHLDMPKDIGKLDF